MFKKLIRLLTPPPFRRTPKRLYIPPSERDPNLATLLRPLLERLLTASRLDDPGAQHALSEIKHLALEKGPYLTAYEINNRLDMMRKVDAEGKPYQKQRGYVLAADFFLRHIREEIANIRTKSLRVGPNIFKGYCNEMVGCLLGGENVRRGVEIPILVVDELLALAIDDFGQSAVYLELAGKAAEATLDLTKDCLVQQKAESPRKRDHLGEAGLPTPQPTSPSLKINEAVVKYVEDFTVSCGRIQQGFHGYVLSLQSEGNAAEAVAKNVPELVARLHSILRIATGAGYRTFCAMVQERIGLALEHVQPGQSTSFFRDAGEHYETQGDVEGELSFTKLSVRRYEQARDQFLRANDQEHVARVQSKLSDMASRRKR